MGKACSLFITSSLPFFIKLVNSLFSSYVIIIHTLSFILLFFIFIFFFSLFTLFSHSVVKILERNIHLLFDSPVKNRSSSGEEEVSVAAAAAA